MTWARALWALLVVLSIALPAQASWWGEAGTAREVTLDRVVAEPEQFRDVPVQIRMTVERRSPAELVGVDDQGRTASLIVEAHRAPASLGKDLLVHGIVRRVVDGRAVLEVLRVTTDGDPLTPEEVEQLAIADRFLDAANPKAAAERYRGLLNRRALPDEVQARVRRRLGSALAQQRRFADAVREFELATKFQPEDEETARLLTRAREGLERQEKGEISAPDPEIKRPRVRLAGPRSAGGVVGRRSAPGSASADAAPPERIALPPGLAERTTEPAPKSGDSLPPKPVKRTPSEGAMGGTTPPRPPAKTRAPSLPPRRPAPRPIAEDEEEEPKPAPPPPRPRLSGPK